VAAITVDHVAKTFGPHRAIDDLSLIVADGELLVLLGPSGCGKTTTMNCIAGLEMPSAGRILFDGADVTGMPPHQRNVAMVFQASTLYPHLTARNNIAMSLRFAGISRSDVRARVAEAAATVDVTALLDKYPGQLSGGERQRVATAKAIVRHPSVFLLDEPLASLDAALRLGLRAELVNLQKRLGTTMIFVTHDQTEAMTMGDRIAIMRSGRLEQIGPPDEIYARPETGFVAAFVGSPPMNLIHGVVIDEAGQRVFTAAGVRIALGAADKVSSGQQVVLGVRPEHLAVADPSATATISAKVFAVEHLGRESILIADGADGGRFRAMLAPGVRQRVGEPVGLVVRDGATLHLFDDGAPGQPLIARLNT
jgi:ABC-type sugar transport system ATPase subunit